ncbi:MAG: hypothetical protein ACD_58C00324G0009 [uncultured bacterium]|nr:MAG: hypothetical protein ACD_58C00324G0009 [uncultured bacterium]
MTEEKWENIKSMVKDKFPDVKCTIEPIEHKIGLTESQKIGQKDVLIFNSPIGKIKLEYLIKPVIIDKKEHYSKRMGATAKTEYILSESEFSRHMDAYKLNDYNEWEKIDSSSFID